MELAEIPFKVAEMFRATATLFFDLSANWKDGNTISLIIRAVFNLNSVAKERLAESPGTTSIKQFKPGNYIQKTGDIHDRPVWARKVAAQ